MFRCFRSFLFFRFLFFSFFGFFAFFPVTMLPAGKSESRWRNPFSWGTHCRLVSITLVFQFDLQFTLEAEKVCAGSDGAGCVRPPGLSPNAPSERAHTISQRHSVLALKLHPRQLEWEKRARWNRSTQCPMNNIYIWMTGLLKVTFYVYNVSIESSPLNRF